MILKTRAVDVLPDVDKHHMQYQCKNTKVYSIGEGKPVSFPAFKTPARLLHISHPIYSANIEHIANDNK